MKIIDQSHSIEWITPDAMATIERIGRTCYKSEEKITSDSNERFVETLVKNGHGAMIEHASMSVRFVTDRGVSHELVRHRLASFAQESTRYCNYGKDKFGNELTFIKPVWFGENEEADMWWRIACAQSEQTYFRCIETGQKPQQARQVLNNSLKTEIVITANFREWQHIFYERANNPGAHPQMVALMKPLYDEMKNAFPAIFSSVSCERGIKDAN